MNRIYEEGELVVLPRQTYAFVTGYCVYIVDRAGGAYENDVQALWLTPLARTPKNFRSLHAKNIEVQPLTRYNVIVNFFRGGRLNTAAFFSVQVLSRPWSSAEGLGFSRYWKPSGKTRYEIAVPLLDRIQDEYGDNPVFMSERYMLASSGKHKDLLRREVAA